MRINTNIASMNAQQISNNTNKEIGSSLEKLASGHSINKASDDAAGLAIADNLRTQSTALNQGIKNANSGVAMIQMADKAMEEISNSLDKMKGLMVQSMNPENLTANNAEAAAAIQADIDSEKANIGRILDNTKYNDIALLKDASSMAFQTGESTGQTITVAVSASLDADVEISVTAGTTAGLEAVDTALNKLNTQRSTFGAGQNQLESSVRSNQVTVVSLQNAESVIRDTDYEAESANFNKLNIVSQAGMYAISQANSSQQNVMKLLQ
jgi:flagellin